MSARKASKKTATKKRYWLFLLLKIAIILLIIIIGYGVYLDNKIRSRIDGHVWQLPAAVYSRMVNLEPGMSYSQPEMVKLLTGMQYRQVTRITRPGEFTIQANRINLLRRPFAFPDGQEGQIAVQLVFDNDHLTRIINQQTQRDYGLFRIDPRLITMLQSPNGEQRLFVARAGFPSLLVDTLIATEDRHFYQHDGISLTSIGRAFLANLTAGRLVQGGSTLTQQLVKNLFLTNKRSLWRKLNEAYMAILVDYRYSKDRILELYLNEVYLGQSGPDQIRGFPLASLYYFGRPVDELSLDQQALLVGMVKGASLYNPWRNPKLALERRNVVLKLLLEQKIIDQQLYDTLSARPLGVQPKGGVISPQPAFMQLVRQELQEKLGDKAEHLSGARIFTTLDPVSQDAAESAVEQGVPELKKLRKLPDLEAAMVVVDRHSGEVRAMVGGAQPQFAGFNRAMTAVRSIGSLAKPPTYLTALSQPDQYRLNTWLPDNPLAIKLSNGQVWQPKNDNRRFTGQVMLVNALAHSMNIPTINLGMNLGLAQVVATWQKLGVDKSAIDQVPAMLLGALNLTPMQVAQAYQTIASGGNRATLSALRSVMDENGKSLYQSYPQAQPVLAPQAAYLTLYAMQQVVAQGTGRSLNARYANYHLAGKTGTTNDLRDSWFAGIDGKEVAISWIGRDNNQPTRFSGSSGALVVYRDYLANSTPLPLQLVPPVGINNIAVDEAGNFLCDSNSPQKATTLPVWTDQPQTVCQQKQQQPIPAADATSPANNNQNGNSNDAPQWVKDMFG